MEKLHINEIDRRCRQSQRRSDKRRATRVDRLLTGVPSECVVAFATALVFAEVANATPSFPKHKCSTFVHHYPPQHGLPGGTYRITVFNGHVSCRTANGLIREFWAGKGHHHGGPSDAQSYWTLKDYPGFRCGQGAGAGACTKGNQIAAYEVR